MLDTLASVDALRPVGWLGFGVIICDRVEAGLALVELSVMEQRYRAVLEVEAGCPVTEVAARHGVSRQSVHAWVRRYRAGGIVEVQRLVGGGGCVGIGGKQISAGIHLAGQRVTLRIDAKLIHVITAGGVLARTLPSPLPPAARGRLHGARLAGPAPAPATAALRVTRVVASQGALMVAGVKIHLGHVHRGKIVTVVIEDSQFRILHDGTQLATHPRTVIKEVTRRSASGHINYKI
jgi:hypothetical protein